MISTNHYKNFKIRDAAIRVNPNKRNVVNDATISVNPKKSLKLGMLQLALTLLLRIDWRRLHLEITSSLPLSSMLK